MYRARQVSNLGGFMSGVNNNGAHSANGITAMFIATGQDVANVAESSAAFTYAELRENGDYYYSLTIPSLIVGTYGGGTGLATQRECLELLGCYGKGSVRKFAEIVAATVLCGELSLGSAIVAEEWVERPRPPRPQPPLAVGEVEPERQAERGHEDQPDPGGDQRLGLVDVADRADEEAGRPSASRTGPARDRRRPAARAASIPQFLDS